MPYFEDPEDDLRRLLAIRRPEAGVPQEDPEAIRAPEAPQATLGEQKAEVSNYPPVAPPTPQPAPAQASPQAYPPVRPAQERYQALQAQGEPQLHGFKKFLNVLGQATFPGVVAAIPGTPLNYRDRLRGAERAAVNESTLGERAAQEQERIAGAEERRARAAKDTAAANAPAKPVKPDSIEQQYADALEELDAARTPQEKQAAQAKVDRLERAANVKTKEAIPKVSPARINYDQGIPVSVVGRDGTTYDVNDPALPPELKPLVAAANRAHKQGLSERENTAANAAARADERADKRANQLTSTTRSMIEAAPKVLQFINRIRPLIDKLEPSIGPIRGRFSEIMTGRYGGGNPEFAKLRTDVGLLQTLLMRMHVGARGGEYIMKHFQDLLDSGKQSPENLRAILGEVEAYANDLVEEGGHGRPAQGSAKPGKGKVLVEGKDF
jgi:hypothetical protein